MSCRRSGLRDEHLPTAAVQVLAAGVTDPALIDIVAQKASPVMKTFIVRPDIIDEWLVSVVASDDDNAADVLVHRPDLAGSRLIDAAVQDGKIVVRMLTARPSLCEQPAFLERVRADSMVAHVVVDAVGLYPALWRVVSPVLRDAITNRYQITPVEQTWLDGLTTRTPPEWTEADDQMAARFR